MPEIDGMLWELCAICKGTGRLITVNRGEQPCPACKLLRVTPNGVTVRQLVAIIEERDRLRDAEAVADDHARAAAAARDEVVRLRGVVTALREDLHGLRRAVETVEQLMALEPYRDLDDEKLTDSTAWRGLVQAMADTKGGG